MIRDIEKEFKAVDDIPKDHEFLQNILEKYSKLLTPQKYKAQIEAAKAEILNFFRKRLVAETHHAAILGSAEAKKMATFLEQLI